MKQWFIRDGLLTWISELLLMVLVLTGLVGIPYFDLPFWLALPIGFISVISAAVLMFEGRASVLGRKPFTNDPLGWRKAKETYKTEESTQPSSAREGSE